MPNVLELQGLETEEPISAVCKSVYTSAVDC
jgi:hypothetical protein